MTQLPQPSFTLIVQLHHLQALLQLGLIPNPATGKPNLPNLAKARHELALLEILEEKTRNNLTDDEEQLLAEVLNATREALDGKDEG